jgi:hypothetical protein
MKSFALLFAVTFLPISGFADELDNQINKACLRHAVSLVAKLKTEVVGELNQDKSDQALKIATDTCQAYFKKEFSQNPESVATATNNNNVDKDDGNVKDWLTEKIISGDTSRKEGNKRLKRIK